MLRIGSASAIKDLTLDVPFSSADVVREPATAATAASGSSTLFDSDDSQRRDMVQQVLCSVRAYHAHLESRLQAYREYLNNAETRKRAVTIAVVAAKQATQAPICCGCL
jgi:hypothetical protein